MVPGMALLNHNRFVSLLTSPFTAVSRAIAQDASQSLSALPVSFQDSAVPNRSQYCLSGGSDERVVPLRREAQIYGCCSLHEVRQRGRKRSCALGTEPKLLDGEYLISLLMSGLFILRFLRPRGLAQAVEHSSVGP